MIEELWTRKVKAAEMRCSRTLVQSLVSRLLMGEVVGTAETFLAVVVIESGFGMPGEFLGIPTNLAFPKCCLVSTKARIPWRAFPKLGDSG